MQTTKEEIYSSDKMDYTTPHEGDTTETVSQPDSQQLAPLLGLLSGTFSSQVQDDPIELPTQPFNPVAHLQPEGQPITSSTAAWCGERQSTSPCTVFTDESDVGAGSGSLSDMVEVADESDGENREETFLDNRKVLTPLHKGRARSGRLFGSWPETSAKVKTPPLLKRTSTITTRHLCLPKGKVGETATEVPVNHVDESEEPVLYSSVLSWNDDVCCNMRKKQIASEVVCSSGDGEEEEDTGGDNESFVSNNGEGGNVLFVADCEQHGVTSDEDNEHSSTVLSDFRRPLSPKPLKRVTQAATGEQQRPMSFIQKESDICLPRPVRANAITGLVRRSTQLPHAVKRARFPNAVPPGVFIRGKTVTEHQ